MQKVNINDSFDSLKEDKESDIRVLELIKSGNSFLIAELKGGKKLPAHYHNKGSEIYHILSGEGKMETGALSGGKVAWGKSFKVASGDVFEIKPGVAHRLSNDGEECLKIVFIAPPSHLNDDRYFV